MAATVGHVPRGPRAPVCSDSGGGRLVQALWGSGSLDQIPPPTRPVTRPGGEPKPLPLPGTTQEERGGGESRRRSCAQRPSHPQHPAGTSDAGGAGRRKGQQRRARQTLRGAQHVLRVHANLPITPLPPALSPAIPATAKACFGSKEGKILPQGRELPWDGAKSPTLRTKNGICTAFHRKR